MAWTYTSLKAALATVPANIVDLQLVANYLNAQTTTTEVDISSRAARSILLSTGEWGMLTIVAESLKATTPTSYPVALIAAAITARDTLADDTLVIQLSIPSVLAGEIQLLGALVSAGIVSQASHDAMLALGVTTILVWSPAITAGDVQTAHAGA